MCRYGLKIVCLLDPRQSKPGEIGPHERCGSLCRQFLVLDSWPAPFFTARPYSSKVSNVFERQTPVH